jgi:ppGpp synthetase/RelA/SpoT-type nucleotidyltranferase
MSDIETARTLWIKERPKYEAFAKYVRERIQKELRPLGIWCDVDARAKDVDSLVKKLIKKPEHTYDTLPDKAGARVIVRYLNEIPPIIDVIRTIFDCKEPENKLEKLGPERFGYLSVHLDDFRFKLVDSASTEYPPDVFRLELQVRTLAQNLWSEMSHDSVYKSDESQLTPNLKRRINLMAGQIEVADREFDRLGKELMSDGRVQLLRALERHYYRYTSRRPDAELSLQVIDKFASLYPGNVSETAQQLDDFLKSKHEVLEHVYEMAATGENADVPDLLFQPEVLLIYERLSHDLSEMREAWSDVYPPKELERIANTFGISFD